MNWLYLGVAMYFICGLVVVGKTIIRGEQLAEYFRPAVRIGGYLFSLVLWPVVLGMTLGGRR